MYKIEPVVADGGEVDHLRAAHHRSELRPRRADRRIGYHCRDYFLAQWDRFSHYPGGILAHRRT